MSPKEKKNTVQIRVFIPPEAYERLQKEAEAKGSTISGITRMIILEHIGKAVDSDEA